jgi:hypothetical protein
MKYINELMQTIFASNSNHLKGTLKKIIKTNEDANRAFIEEIISAYYAMFDPRLDFLIPEILIAITQIEDCLIGVEKLFHKSKFELLKIICIDCVPSDYFFKPFGTGLISNILKNTGFQVQTISLEEDLQVDQNKLRKSDSVFILYSHTVEKMISPGYNQIICNTTKMLKKLADLNLKSIVFCKKADNKYYSKLSPYACVSNPAEIPFLVSESNDVNLLEGI